MLSISNTWWHDLYDDLLAEMLLVRADRAELDATVRFITEQLSLSKGDRVFDQCCGIGSLAIELAATGLRVFGVEQSARYVERAIAAANERRENQHRNLAQLDVALDLSVASPALHSREPELDLDLVAGDAREHIPSARVRGAFNWWTSFGYSEDDADNARMLARAFDALEPGGVFLLDTMNLPNIFRSFQDETVTRRATSRGEITLLRRSRIDSSAGVMRKRWSYVLPDGQLVEKPESVVRLYMPHTLVDMLESVGFENVTLFGSIHGDSLGLDSTRCICRAQKPSSNGSRRTSRTPEVQVTRKTPDTRRTHEICEALPANNMAARQALYDGNMFMLAPTSASQQLVRDVRDLIASELGGTDDEIREIPSRLDGDTWFEKIGNIRRALFLGEHFHARVRDLISSYGFDPARTAFDPLRLRAIAHNGHENPRAAPVYYAHRDTWYAHSQAIVTWWVPLDDLGEEETFELYPDRFHHPVPNDSEVFDYDAWVRDGWSLKIGWQDPEAGRRARYPSVIGEPDPGRAVAFSCRRAQTLLFSGAHFHKTRPQATGRARFSLDFRAVDLDDHTQGLGAPNVDNRSRGSALPDYTMPLSAAGGVIAAPRASSR